jgi:hypothetical protein
MPRFTRIPSLLLLSAFALLPDVALPKCATVQYEVSGVVLDCGTGQPLQGAQAVLFPQDRSEAWAAENAAASLLSTDAQGGYHGTFPLSLYRGPHTAGGRHDDCSRRLTELTVFITCSGYRSRKVVLSKNRLPEATPGSTARIAIPAVTLVREGSQCSSP